VVCACCSSQARQRELSQQRLQLCLLTHCFRWFDLAAGTTTAVLTASSQLPAKQAADQGPYTVKVYTTHLRGAGTDSNVCINAIGTAGSSGWRELPARQGTFEHGQVRPPRATVTGHCCSKSLV
jgi:hypothetical protein